MGIVNDGLSWHIPTQLQYRVKVCSSLFKGRRTYWGAAGAAARETSPVVRGAADVLLAAKKVAAAMAAKMREAEKTMAVKFGGLKKI